MKKIKYPELVAEMAKNGHTQATIGKLLGVTHGSISRRLSGEIEWTISEIDELCKFYNKDYYQLFKKENN